MKVDTIIHCTALHFSLPVERFACAYPSTPEACRARRIVLFLAWKHSRISFSKIAVHLGMTTRAAEEGAQRARENFAQSMDFREDADAIESRCRTHEAQKVAAVSIIVADGKIMQAELNREQLASLQNFIVQMGLEMTA